MSFICLLFVIPAEAEIYVFVSFLDSRFCRDFNAGYNFTFKANIVKYTE